MFNDLVYITSEQRFTKHNQYTEWCMIKYAKVLIITPLYMCIEQSSLQSTYTHKLI